MEDGVRAPRVARVPFPYNYPLGNSGDRAEHKRAAVAALGLLHELEDPAEVAVA